MFYVGQIIGGILGIFILFVLWEFALFKRVLDDPLKGKLFSAGAAYLTGATVAGFGGADGGPYYWGAFLDYLIPGMVVTAYAFRNGQKARTQTADTAELESTFK